MLPEDKRKQLDGIVQQMVQNKESDSNIRFVVDDFKKKYTPIETKAPIKQPGYFQRVGQEYAKAGQDIISGIKQGATDIQGGGLLGGVRAGLRTVGGVAKATFAPITEAPGIKQGIELAGKGVQKLSETAPIKAAGEAISPLTEKLMGLAQKYPETAKDVEDIVNIAIVGGGKAVSEPLAGATGKTLIKTGKAVEKGAMESLETKQGEFIRKLVRPEQTKAVKEAQVARTTEVGVGPLKRSVIAPTPQELRMEEAVKGVKGIAEKNTFQRNYNFVKSANRQEAENLVSQLEQVETQVGKDRGFFTPNEFNSYMNSVKKELADNPLLVGDAEKTASKILDKFSSLVKEEGHTPRGLLSARKKLDAWMESQKGPNIFDPKTESAVSIALRGIRQGGNTFLASKVPDVAVIKSLEKQTALYNTLDNLAPKAAREADTAIGRAFQRAGDAVGIRNEVVRNIAAATGIFGIGAISLLNPFAGGVATATALSFLMYKGGKLILKPELRVQFGKLLQLAGNKITPQDRKIIENAIQGKEITEGFIRGKPSQ